MGLPKIRFSKLQRYHFVDSEDIDIGSLEDIALDKDSLKPQYLVLGAGFFEELMEELGNRDDIDEIAPLDMITEIDGDHVLLAMPIDDFDKTNKDGDLPKKYNGILFSSLKEFTITDSGGQVEAKLLDLILDGDNSVFIFDYPALRMPLMSEGYNQRFEVAYHINSVKTEKQNLILPATEAELVDKTKETIQPKMKGKSIVEWN